GVHLGGRCEGLAQVGGICISRAVHEQVANKLSVQFADIGEQEVKNIPTPVHAYMVAMRREDGTYAPPQIRKKSQPHAAPSWMWPAVVMVVCLAAIGVGGFLYFTKMEMPAGLRQSLASNNVAPSPPPSVAPSPAASPATPSPLASTSPSPTPAPAPISASAAPSPAPPPVPSGEKLVAETVPFVPDRSRVILANDYLPAADYKA